MHEKILQTAAGKGEQYPAAVIEGDKFRPEAHVVHRLAAQVCHTE
jgi:hypothetical protein